MVAATIANRKDANSQGVTPAPDKSLQENDPQQLTTGPSAFNPRDIRKQIQAGVQAPAATKATDVISAAEAAFEATSLQLREQHQQLSEVAKTTSDLRNGQVRMREEGQKEVAAYEASWSKYNPWSSRFYERGLIEQKNKDNEAADTYAKALEAHEKELKSTLERSQTTLNDATTTFKESQGLRKEADKVLERARELAAANKEQEARTEAEKAKELTVRSLERLQEAQKLQQEALRSLPQSEQLRSIPESATAQYQQSIRASSAQLTQIDKQLEQTQEYIRMARNTTIVIGAAVATGGLATTGLATTYGVVGAGAIAIGGGTAAGTGIGLAATAAEQGRAVAEGQKTAQAAFQDGLQQTGQDAQVALTTSVATYTGMASLSKLAPKMTTLLGGSKLAATTSTVASGGIATVPSTLLQEGLDVTVNGKEFGGVADLGGKILKNGVAGGLGTSIGVLGNAARSTNAVRNIAVTGSEGLADATVSVGIEATDAAIRGKEFSSKDAWATFNQAIVGTITGEMSSKAQGRMGRGRDDPADSRSGASAEIEHRTSDGQKNGPRSTQVEAVHNPDATARKNTATERRVNTSQDTQARTVLEVDPVTGARNATQSAHVVDEKPAAVESKIEKNTDKTDASAEQSVTAVPDRLPFGGMTGEYILNELAPPTPLTGVGEVKTVGPKTYGKQNPEDHGVDRYTVTHKVPADSLSYPADLKPAGNTENAAVEMYYHNYRPNDPNWAPPNWRYNVSVGRNNYVALRPTADARGPFKCADLEIFRRGPSNDKQVKDSANSFIAGTATPAEVTMLTTTWKGMEQLNDVNRMKVIQEQGLLAPEKIAQIKDIMNRGHFIPGTYVPST